MCSEYQRQAELEWTFQRARDRFHTYKAHFGKLLPQLTGFTSPQMNDAVERFLELRIKGPLCQSRAEMLESFDALQKLKKRRQTAESFEIAEQVARAYEAERGATRGGTEDAQQAMLFGPGAPTSEPSLAPRTPRPADEDEAVFPGTDPLLYGFEDADDADGDDGDDGGQYAEEWRREDVEASEQAGNEAERSVDVPLRRRTLEQTLEDLQHARQSADGDTAFADIASVERIIAGLFGAPPRIRRTVARSVSSGDAARPDPERPDGGISADLLSGEMEAPDRCMESVHTPASAEDLFAALANAGAAAATDGPLIKVTPTRLDGTEASPPLPGPGQKEGPSVALVPQPSVTSEKHPERGPLDEGET